MGDRANFGFTSKNAHDGHVVYLYGHWAGEQMMHNLAKALDRVRAAGRLSDPYYGTRIAISELVGDNWNQDLSWGISVNTVPDNEHSVPVVDWDTQTVSLYDENGYPGSNPEDTIPPKFTMDIRDFINRFLKEAASV